MKKIFSGICALAIIFNAVIGLFFYAPNVALAADEYDLSLFEKFTGQLSSDDGAGYSVSSAGDVNGDGYDDMLVGAWGYNYDLWPGAAYLIYGSSEPFSSASLSTAVKFSGEEDADEMGYSVSSAGDVNNDGYDDILLGAECDSDAASCAGAAYLIYGKSDLLTSDAVSTAVKFTGEAADDNAGATVSSAGDVNGDDYDDFLIGAMGEDSYAGAAYLIYGSGSALTSDSLSNAIKFSGESASDYAGASMAPAGDVDNDGYDDFLIGAYGDDDAFSGAGAAYLIYGQSGDLTSDSLSSAVKFTGEASSDSAGISVSSAGDVDGDGYSDIIIGATGEDTGGSGAGAAYLLYGKADDFVDASLSTAVKFTGEVAGDKAGWAVSSAGDVDNDGYDDILVSAYENEDAGRSAGSVYLIYGDSVTLTDASLSTKVEFTGVTSWDYAGSSVSSAGDLNGDGYYDFLIGAPGSDEYYIDGGSVYVVYGQSDALTSTSLSNAIVFSGEHYYSDIGYLETYTGYSVSSAGDVDGDGYDDFLVGATNFSDNAGVAYLIYGSSSSLSSVSLSTAVKFIGEYDGDYAGISVSSAGDVNSDGYDDFLVGADYEDTGGSDAGAAYLIYGQSERFTGSYSLSTAVKFYGEAAGDDAGISVSSAGDVNGDGYDDFLVGADYNSDGASNAGAAYLIYGKSEVFTSASLSTAVQFTGVTAGDYAGWSVSSAGDVNGDGYDDILVGDDYNSDEESYAGAAYLIYGKSDVHTSASLSTAVEFTGESAGDYAGYSVSSAGDVNADGYDDILVGSWGEAAYLIYGQADDLTSDSLSNAVKFTGESAGDYAGTSVSSAGDVNGDGYSDILIGAYGEDTGGGPSGDGEHDGGTAAGAAYLIYGSGSVLTSASLSTADKFIGVNAGDEAGYSVASAGDLNGDGIDEVLIGADYDYAGGSYAGAAYVGYLYIDADGDGYPGADGLVSGTDLDDSNAAITDVMPSTGSSPTWQAKTPEISNLIVSQSGVEASGILSCGLVIDLDWESQGTVPFVNISYSSDGGVTWESIYGPIQNTDNVQVSLPTNIFNVLFRVEATDLVETINTLESQPLSVSCDASQELPSELPSDDTEEDVFAGDYIRSYSFSTVYYLDSNYDRHPFWDAQTFFTWQDSFDNIKFVEDETLSLYPLKSPVVPKPQTVLVKIQSDPSVFIIEKNLEDGFSPTLHEIENEQVAEGIFGSNWTDYIIDLEPTVFGHFQFGSVVTDAGSVTADLTSMKTRAELNK